MPPPSRISARVAAIAESATLAVDAKAKALKAAGEPVIGFGAGEPDFPTPDHIVEAAVAACRVPRYHKYTPAAGLPELRDAIAVKTKRDSGYEVTAAQVLVTNGGKHAVYNTFATLLDPGDEVLLPAPYWTTYPEPIRLAGGVPVVLQTDERTGFRVTVDQLEAAVTERTKILMFVSPSNPTGAVYPPAEVEAIGRWAVERGIWVVTDEIYEHLTYGDHAFSSMPTLVPELADRCVVLNGVAKTYAMTGWRVGWMIGPPDVVKAAANLQSHATSNVANVSQAAALAAVSGDLERGGRDAGGLRPPGPDDGAPPVRHPRRPRARAAGRLLRLPEPVGLRGAHHPGRHPRRHPRPVCRAARPGQGGRGPGRGVRRPWLRPHVVRTRRRRPRRGLPAHRRPPRRGRLTPITSVSIAGLRTAVRNPAKRTVDGQGMSKVNSWTWSCSTVPVWVSASPAVVMSSEKSPDPQLAPLESVRE